MSVCGVCVKCVCLSVSFFFALLFFINFLCVWVLFPALTSATSTSLIAALCLSFGYNFVAAFDKKSVCMFFLLYFTFFFTYILVRLYVFVWNLCAIFPLFYVCVHLAYCYHCCCCYIKCCCWWYFHLFVQQQQLKKRQKIYTQQNVQNLMLLLAEKRYKLDSEAWFARFLFALHTFFLSSKSSKNNCKKFAKEVARNFRLEKWFILFVHR